MRKHSFLIIVSIILINFLFLNITDSLGSDIESEINAQLKELEKMKSEQAKLDQELKKLEKTQKNIAAEIQNIENKIEKLEKDITTSRNRILQLEKDRAHLRKDIEGLSQDISSSKTKISQAMVRAYKNNVNFDFWSVFLGSSDPSEVEEQWYLFQKYSDHEMSNISKYLNKRQNLQNKLKEIYEQKVSEVNDQVFREVERFVGLRVVDGYWKEQLHNMDHLREGIGLRAVGQKDPFVEYQIEAFDMFHEMIAQIREDIVRYLLRIRLVPEGSKPPAPSRRPVQSSPVRTDQVQPLENQKPDVAKKGKIGRNDPCPCGSGKKYKYCCGK
jgi:preprotein translocase subunit SecA